MDRLHHAAVLCPDRATARALAAQRLRPLGIRTAADPYVDQMAWWLGENNVGYWRWGNGLFLRILPVFDGTEHWSRYDVINNAEWKVADGIMHDITISGVFYPTPEAVKRIEALPPPDPNDMDAQGERICALFRAAVLEEPY